MLNVLAVLIPIAAQGIAEVMTAIEDLKANGATVIDLSTLKVETATQMLADLGITQAEIDKILAGQSDVTPP